MRQTVAKLLCFIFLIVSCFALVGCRKVKSDKPETPLRPTLSQQKLKSLNNTVYNVNYSSNYSEFVILKITTAYHENASSITIIKEKLLPNIMPTVIENVTITFTKLDEFNNVCGIINGDQYKFKQNEKNLELTKNDSTNTYSQVKLKQISSISVSYSAEITNVEIIDKFNNSYYEVLKSYNYFPDVMKLTSGQQAYKVNLAYLSWKTENPWSKLAVYTLSSKYINYKDYNYLFDNFPTFYDNSNNDIIIRFNELLETFPDYINYDALSIEGGTYEYSVGSNFFIICKLDVQIENFKDLS